MLGTFTLSDNHDPLLISYESVAPNLTLDPGIYFALLAPQGSDEGLWLGSHSSPDFLAPLTTVDAPNPNTGASSASQEHGAARILGVAPPLIGPPASKDQCKKGGWKTRSYGPRRPLVAGG